MIEDYIPEENMSKSALTHRHGHNNNPTPTNDGDEVTDEAVHPSGKGKRPKFSAASRFSKAWILPHWKVKVARVLCALYAYLSMYRHGPLKPGYWTAVSITKLLSYMSAFALYPDAVVVFLAKCRALESLLDKTPLSLYMQSDMHEVHVYSGKWLFWFPWSHVFFQLLSYGLKGSIDHLWTKRVGRTGIVMIICLQIICVPMMFRSVRVAIRYEIRKGLHYLFVAFAIALSLHVPISKLPWHGYVSIVIPIALGIYIVDLVYIWLFMSTKAETTNWQVLKSGVQVTVEVPKSFTARRQHGGYAYVCVPWVDKNQWHAFSLYETPRQGEKSLFMMKTGDWTKSVHHQLQRNTRRPIWLQGPFTSPYTQDHQSDNLILIAGGIGITPALSTIASFQKTRNVTLIWIVRDESMLEFYLGQLSIYSEANFLIFYTGKDHLNQTLYLEGQFDNININLGRPVLDAIIPNIIHDLENGDKLSSFTNDRCGIRKNDKVIGNVFDKLTELEEGGANDDIILRSISDLVVHGNNLQMKPFLDEVDAHLDKTAPDSQPSCVPESNGGVLNQIRQIRARLGPRRSVGQRFSTSTLKAGKSSTPWKENNDAKAYVKALDKHEHAVLDTWGMLFCGGNKAIEDNLKAISEEYGVKLHSESFEW